MLKVVEAWFRHQLDNYDLIAEGKVFRFASRLSIRSVLIANIINLLLHVVLNGVGLLPYSLGQALIVGLSATTVITFTITYLLSYTIGKSIHELSISRDAFAKLSLVDPLSGLLNRRAFFDRIESCKSDAVFVLFDIDRFKSINDTYGHVVGDEVIQGVARVLLGVFAEEDAAVARMGGEEFSVVIRKKSHDQHMSLIDTARSSVAAMTIASCPDRVTISAGVAEIGPEREMPQVYRSADHALYMAKSSGRDCVVHENDVSVLKRRIVVEANPLQIYRGISQSVPVSLSAASSV